MKNKGFTLVELLAAMVILAILIMIGVMTVSNVFDNTKENYYTSMENTLNIAGNEFFNDNRQEKPIDDYNFVDLATLQEHEYLEELMTYDNKEKCDPKSGVFIFNDNDHTGYEVCLICGDHKSKGDFCNGKKMGVIDVSGNVNEPNGPFYNPLLSYSGTSWINALSIYIHFNLETEGMSVSEYKIYNANTNGYVGSCTGMSGNSCTKSFSTTGSYYVEAYGTQSGVEGSGKIANRKYFNVKIDNTPPTFSLKDTDPIIELEKDNIVEPYENEVIDINDDNGYKEVKYSLEQYKGKNADGTEKYDPVSGHTDVDIKDKDLKIPASLESGKYKLRVTVTDFAGNKGKCNNCTNKETNEIIFYIKYKIDLQYYDKSDKKHDVGNLWIYTYGLYREEDASGTATKNLPTKIRVNSDPQDVDWYMNANLVGNVVTSYEPQVQKTGYHVLYAREQKMKTTFKASCNAGLIYKGQNAPAQTLVNIPPDEQGKYRLIVYYNNTLMPNEAKDARTYTVIAVLNSDYMWSDTPAADAKKAKAIRCEILPKKVPVPSCTNPTYEPRKSVQLINVVDSKGEYSEFGELAITTVANKGAFTSKPVTGMNAGSYSMTVSIDKVSKNFSWDGTSNYDFSDKTLNCEIKKKPIPFPSISCSFSRYTGMPVYLISGLSEGGLVVDPMDGDKLAGDGEQGGGINVGESLDSPDVPWDTWNADYYPQDEYDRGEGGVSPYSISPIAGLNAKDYTVKVTLNPNYTWSSAVPDLKCAILPAIVKPTPDFSLEYDDYKAEGSKYVDGDGSCEIEPDIASYFKLQYTVKDTNKATDTFSCDVSIVDHYSFSMSDAGVSNYELSPSSVNVKIKDTVAPTCDSVSVNTSGTITATASDNYGFGDDKKATETKYPTASVGSGGASKKNTIEFVDHFGNPGYCEINVSYGPNATVCGTHNTCSGACQGTADEGTTACSQRSYANCDGTGCSWNSCASGSHNDPLSCYYEG